MTRYYSEAEPIPSVVMTPGGGLTLRDEEYTANRVTAGRAEEAANYWDLTDPDDSDETGYLFSGWYGRITGRGNIAEPRVGVSEADLARGVFTRRVWEVNQRKREAGSRGRPFPRTGIEGRSVDSFTNIIESVDAGFLPIGGFTRRRPLVLSTGQGHAWRMGLIAGQALALEPGSLLRLRTSPYEREPVTRGKEHALLAMTRLAFADVGEFGGAEPGNLWHTRAAAQAFEEMSKMPVASLRRALAHPALWRSVEVPLLRY